MTGNLKVLSNLENIVAIPIELPDEMLRMATVQEAIKLGSKGTFNQSSLCSKFSLQFGIYCSVN